MLLEAPSPARVRPDFARLAQPYAENLLGVGISRLVSSGSGAMA